MSAGVNNAGMTVSLSKALQGSLRGDMTARTAAEPALLIGAGGWLGAAMLAQLLGAGHARVGAWVERSMGSTHRGVVGLRWDEILRGDDAWRGACAYIVLERAGLVGARDAVFGAPRPERLLDIAQGLRQAGVRRLVLVLPHLAGSLPEALRHGFADRNEQMLATLGFEQLLIVRSSREAEGSAPGSSWLQRFAALWWAQLKWMLPSEERPLRSVALARVVVAASRLLRERSGSVFVLPQQAASRALHDADGIDAALRRLWP